MKKVKNNGCEKFKIHKNTLEYNAHDNFSVTSHSLKKRRKKSES